MIWTWRWAVWTMNMSVSMIWGMIMVTAGLGCVVVSMIVATGFGRIVIVSTGLGRIVIVSTGLGGIVVATGT